MLSIVIVNFQSGHRLKQCLDSILAHPPATAFEIIVWENGSTDGSADFLMAASEPRVRLLRSPVNLGYTWGAKHGFDAARGEYVLMLNADMIARPGSIDAMVRHLEEDPDLGGVGGHCLRPDGTFEKYVNRFPTPLAAWWTMLGQPESARKHASYRRYHMLDDDFTRPIEAPQPAGMCIMVRRSLFPRGIMSERVFGIYWSDVELARRVYLAGKRVMVFPDAPFVHDHKHGGSGNPELGLLLDLDCYVGAVRYFRLYDGGWSALRLKTLMAARLLARLLTVEILAVARRRQGLRHYGRRVRLLWDFLRDRNVLLERFLSAADARRQDLPA